MNKLFSIIIFNLIISICFGNTWGHLANTGFENQTIKSTLFFSGNWRNGVQFYDYNPTSNTGLYTIHPSDSRHLGWSENIAFREFAIDAMIDAGINVINMSYWGLPGSDNWAYWAPMQTSTESHDELFDAALGKNILIAPYIESYNQTGNYQGFSFMADFPGTAINPAPKFIEIIEDLIERYLITPSNSEWPEKWARVYDQSGNERYLISIIHVASDSTEITDQAFAEGFDNVANKVFVNTGVRIGFALDILPKNTYAPGAYKATPLNTGVWLAVQESVLAIQCFIPEIWTGYTNEQDLINWKANYATAWQATGIPFIHDISSGYDAHIIFPSSIIYGNNNNWRNAQSQHIQDLNSQSFTFNAWNGYTEGFAGIPTLQYGDTTYKWICDIFGGTCGVSSSREDALLNTEMINVYPNPASSIVTVKVNLQNNSQINIKVYDSYGILQDNIYKDHIDAGVYEFQWQPPSNISSNILFFNIETHTQSSTLKVLLLPDN